jgi:hypothetical protein
MKIALPATGVALLTVGVIWILQGMNILPGSFMTGQQFWAWAGIVSALVGGTLLFFGLNRRAPR